MREAMVLASNPIPALVFIIISGSAWSSEGFVLKAGDGEEVLKGVVVKASPRTGTEGSILVEQTFEKGRSTGLHLHEQGDELFYVVSGKGVATIGDVEQPIGPGDVIFVPASGIHRIRNLENDDSLVVIFFMDSRELVDFFRAMHERRIAEPDRPITADEIAELGSRTGGQESVE
jgi:quercetin dioxygenase-like cupin family protein